MRHHGICFAFFGLLCLSLLALAHPSAQAATKKQTKAASLSLFSDTKDLTVTLSGQRRSMNPQQALRLNAGWQELQLTAPAQGTRRVRYWLKDGETLAAQVSLAPLIRPQIPLEWRSADRVLSIQERDKLASTCRWYKERHSARTLCQRDSWLEDIHYAEPDPFDSEELRDLEKRGELDSYRKLLSQRESDELESTRAIETFYARYANIPAAFRLAAHHSLSRGDCPRVHSIFVEAQQTLVDLRPIAFYKAICSELQGQLEASTSLLRDAIALRADVDAPYLRYHLGRQLLPSKPQEALNQAQTCTQKNPGYIPCHELGMMASTLLKKPYKLPKNKFDEGTFKAFLSLETALKEKRYDAAFLSLSYLLSSHPQSLEFYLMLSWLEATQAFGTNPQFIEQKLNVGLSLSPSTLETLIDTLENKNLSRLLPPVYKNKLRAHPEDPNLWLRLVRSYSQSDLCPETLEAIKTGAHVLPKFNMALLEIKGHCQLKLGNWVEATETYRTLMELSVPSWNLYLQLGKSLQAQKKDSEADTAYRKALELSPPPAAREEIEQRLARRKVPARSGKSIKWTD